MAPKRYTVILANRTSGATHRFTFSLRPTLVVLGLFVAMPILMGIGARWSVWAELNALRTMAATTDQENRSYRAATLELTSQIESLRGALQDISDQRSALDGNSSAALERLQTVLRSQGTGGAAASRLALNSALAPALALPEDSFGTLMSLLGQLDSKLKLVRTDVARQATIAAATPSTWPAYGALSASFGPRPDPFGEGNEFHAGLDISTQKGAPVFATGAGRVVSSEYNAGYGNLLAVDHGYGLVTRYAHLSAFAVRAGQEVSRGQVIGYVGSTGRTTGPHLHYELLVRGVQTNPLTLIVNPDRH